MGEGSSQDSKNTLTPSLKYPEFKNRMLDSQRYGEISTNASDIQVAALNTTVAPQIRQAYAVCAAGGDTKSFSMDQLTQ